MKNPFEKSELVRYLITSGETRPDNFAARSDLLLKQIRAAVDAGFELIQIREKQLPARYLFDLGSAASEIADRSKTSVFINDRADIAKACGADGVHLPANSISASMVREHFSDLMIGVSAHSDVEIANAIRSGADFATFGPVFRTPSKEKFGEPQGIDSLRAVCISAGSFPVVAIGGIDENNLDEIERSGARGVAAIRFFSDPGAFTS